MDADLDLLDSAVVWTNCYFDSAKEIDLRVNLDFQNFRSQIPQFMIWYQDYALRRLHAVFKSNLDGLKQSARELNLQELDNFGNLIISEFLKISRPVDAWFQNEVNLKFRLMARSKIYPILVGNDFQQIFKVYFKDFVINTFANNEIDLQSQTISLLLTRLEIFGIRNAIEQFSVKQLLEIVNDRLESERSSETSLLNIYNEDIKPRVDCCLETLLATDESTQINRTISKLQI